MRYALAIVGLAAAAQASINNRGQTAEVTITSCAETHTNCPYKASSTWGDWDNWSSTTSSKPTEPTSTTSWSAWDGSKTSKTPVASSSTTWSNWNDPSSKTPVASSAEAWSQWNSASSKTPVASSTGSWSAWSGVSTPVASSTKPSCPKMTDTKVPDWFSQLPSPVLSSMAAQWTNGPPADWCYYSYSVQSTVATQTKTPVQASSGPSGTSWANWTPAAATATPIATFKGDASAKTGSFVLVGAAALAAAIIV